MTVAGEAAPPAAHETGYRWVVLSGIWLVYFSFGLQIAALAPLVGVVSADLSLSYARMGAILSAWPLLYVFASIPGGALVDRIGTRKALLLATALMAVSAIARPLADDFWTMFFAVAVFGIGGPLLSVTSPKAVAHWFGERERGLAMGIYFTGVSIGLLAGLSLTNTVMMPLTGGDWRAVLWIYAAVVIAGGLGWAALSSRAAFRRTEAWDATAGRGTVRDQIAGFGYLLRRPAVLLILLMSMGIFFYYDSTNAWLPEILVAHGFDPADAGVWASAPVFIGIFGALVVPRLATDRRRALVLLGLFGCIVAGALCLMASDPLLVGVAFFLFGVARGGLMTVGLMMLVSCRDVGRHQLGAAGGLFFTAAELGGVFGPVSFGVLFDATGGFGAALAVLAGVGVLLVILLGLHHRVEARRVPVQAAQA
jgi:cyanate permease